MAASAGTGGDLTGRGLQAIDPERYGSFDHPGDAFSYDIFIQVARAPAGGGGSRELADTLDCGAPINGGPQHFLVKAALWQLDTWVRTGEAPPEAPRLEADATPAIRRDRDGFAVGGTYEEAADAAIASGFVLADDRQALLDDADPSGIPG